MSLSGSNATAGGGFWHWSSPMPYLFGGLAFMLGIIAIALIILACSYRKSSLSNSSDRVGEEKSVKQVELEMVDFEPKIVVIMAGDHNPTYLAMPKPVQEQVVGYCNCQNNQEQV
ncbi:hypothetical protein JCGZ_25631 [Jatropha curcas]|uniref:Uncharacterized protein n=1 Tax=Jatropha curcas TaxID=180498 RepID=A0A067JWF6_JATCU|nr:protein GLUTAMINE DUMPER 3 [Jatropha curcas]KDP24335.1 hypothetical protein JCGZ_25631 [Jatropha curcas]